MKKEKMGFFLTDASLDHKTKNAKLSIIDISKDIKKQINYSTVSVVEAEKEAIVKALKEGLNQYQNIIVFNDNLFAVKKVKKEIFTKDNIFTNKYYFIQIIWIPREYNEIADFFSKVIKNKEIEKKEKMNSYLDYINRNEVKISNLDKIIFLKELIIKVKSINLELFFESFLNEEEISFFKELFVLLLNKEDFNNIEESFFAFLEKVSNEKQKEDFISFLHNIKKKIKIFQNNKTHKTILISIINLIKDLFIVYMTLNFTNNIKGIGKSHF